tara:strand:+ start:2683 stop:2961 length:279 start_codon:yes stop_codon:yes gene_type:complete
MTIHDFDTLLQFATELVSSGTRQETRNVLDRFAPSYCKETHPQIFVLREIAAAINARGSWEACSPLHKRLIKQRFSDACLNMIASQNAFKGV